MSTKRSPSPETFSPDLSPQLRPESRLFPWWMFHPAFLWTLTVAAGPAVILGCVMPMSLAYQPPVRTPYELPAHHSVFVYTDRGSVDCVVLAHGDVHSDPIDQFATGNGDLIPFTGHRLPPQAAAGATLMCESRVVITVDPDWRYTLANNQLAKTVLTFFGVFGLAWVYKRVRDVFRRRRRPVPVTFAARGGSGSSPRRGTWRLVGRRRVPRR